jgi:hypothetical protein
MHSLVATTGLSLCGRTYAPAARRALVVKLSDSTLSEKKCYPCEAAKDSLDHMGLTMTMDRAIAEKYLAQVGGTLLFRLWAFMA